MTYSGMKKCKAADEGCLNAFPNDRWGAILAAKSGWFLQRNDDAWCPIHIPAWVAEWRARKNSP